MSKSNGLNNGYRVLQEDNNSYKPSRKVLSSGPKEDFILELNGFFNSKIIALDECIKNYIKKHISCDAEGSRFSEEQLKTFVEILGIKLVGYSQEDCDEALNILDLVYNEENLKNKLVSFIKKQFALYVEAEKEEELLGFINFFYEKDELQSLIDDLSREHGVELQQSVDDNSGLDSAEDAVGRSRSDSSDGVDLSEGSSEGASLPVLGSTDVSDTE